MKYSNFLLLLIASVSFHSSTQELVQLRKDEIAKKAIVIEKMMQRDRYVMYGLTALSVAQSVYPWIALYQKGLEVKPDDQKLTMWQSIKATFNHLFFTQEGWTSMGLASVSLGGAYVISRVCDAAVHPDTLRWYAHSHAPYDLTISLMKERLTLLQNPVLEEQEHLHERKFLSLLYKRLVNQSEAVCAYMMYKSKRLDIEEKDIAKRAVHSFFTVQNYWLPRIAMQVNSETINYQECEKILIAYENDMQCHINHFSIIEGESLEDKRFVKRLVKRVNE